MSHLQRTNGSFPLAIVTRRGNPRSSVNLVDRPEWTAYVLIDVASLGKSQRISDTESDRAG